jgi:hypothetical protein
MLGVMRELSLRRHGQPAPRAVASPGRPPHQPDRAQEANRTRMTWKGSATLAETVSREASLAALSPDCRAVINHFVYSMVNGLLGYPLLESTGYQSVLIEEGSAAEQACAIFCNVLELDEDGRPTNANEAETRAAQYIRAYCDRDYVVDPPFEDWETDRPPRAGGKIGPMP